MKPPVQRVIEVWADWATLGQPTRLGTLTATPARGKEIFAFEYDPAWLKSSHAQSLDPSLRLFSGPQYPSAGKTAENTRLRADPLRSRVSPTSRTPI